MYFKLLLLPLLTLLKKNKSPNNIFVSMVELVIKIKYRKIVKQQFLILRLKIL